MSQTLSSAAVVIGALKVKDRVLHTLMQYFLISVAEPADQLSLS